MMQVWTTLTPRDAFITLLSIAVIVAIVYYIHLEYRNYLRDMRIQKRLYRRHTRYGKDIY
jgi:hypothetical protein